MTQEKLTTGQFELIQVKAEAYDKITKLEQQVSQLVHCVQQQDAVIGDIANKLNVNKSEVASAVEQFVGEKENNKG